MIPIATINCFIPGYKEIFNSVLHFFVTCTSSLWDKTYVSSGHAWLLVLLVLLAYSILVLNFILSPGFKDLNAGFRYYLSFGKFQAKYSYIALKLAYFSWGGGGGVFEVRTFEVGEFCYAQSAIKIEIRYFHFL